MNDQPTYQNEEQSCRIARLLAAHLQGNASWEEMAELLKWREKDPRNSALFTSLSNSRKIKTDLLLYSSVSTEQAFQKLTERIALEQAAKNKKGPKILLLRIGIAAVLTALIFSASLLIYHYKAPKIQPAGLAITKLTFSDGRTLILDSSAGTISAGQNKITNQQGQTLSKNVQQSELVLLEVHPGHRQQITLADGTQVWLNAGSSLRFPLSFSKQNRKVEMTGEAYFDVVHDQQRPFQVNSPSQTVSVMGTAFNLRAFVAEQSRTTLIRGLVKVSAKTAAKPLILHPGEQAILSQDGTLHSCKADLEAETAWKNGAISFEGKSFQENMSEVARSYGLELRYQGSIPSQQLRGSINTGGSTAPVEAILQAAGIKFTLSAGQLIIHGKEAAVQHK
jgi:ferric-dicitrate binding protein FerR (iron transport regulator)